MNPDIYKETEKFIVSALGKTNNKNDILHAKRTVYWIKQLKPDADIALLIAGLTHDIERAFYGDWKAGSDDPKLLKKHQDLSAKEAEKFLKQKNVDKKTIEKVKALVTHHEEGGDEDQNILCDADCLAYFEKKATLSFKNYKQKENINKIIKKIEYVFSRISSSEARQIAQKWHDDILQKLGKTY